MRRMVIRQRLTGQVVMVDRAGHVDVVMRETAVVVKAFLRIHEQYLQARYGHALHPSPSSREHDFRMHFPCTFKDMSGGSFGAALMGERGREGAVLWSDGVGASGFMSFFAVTHQSLSCHVPPYLFLPPPRPGDLVKRQQCSAPSPLDD